MIFTFIIPQTALPLVGMKPVKRQPQIAYLLIHILRRWTNAAKTQRTVERRSRKDDSQTLQRRNLRKRITNKVKHEYNTHEYYTRVSLYL